MKPTWNNRYGYPNCPCRGCDTRETFCHTNCERYADWKAGLNAESIRKAAIRQTTHDLHNIARDPHRDRSRDR